MELIIIFLVFGGGLFLSIFFMFKANKHKDNIARMLIYSALVFGCLFAQRSCWNGMSNFGSAFGGSRGSSNDFDVSWIIVFWSVWTVVMIYGSIARKKLKSNDSDQPESETESLSNESKRIIDTQGK